MTGFEVKEKLVSLGYKLTDIAQNMNITPQSLHKFLLAEDIKTGVLERIAKAIGKDILYFYDFEIKGGSNLDEMQLAIDFTKNRKNVNSLYQRIVDIDIILDEKFGIKRNGGYASDVCDLRNIILKNFELRISDTDEEDIKFVSIKDWSFAEKEKYNEQLKQAIDTLTETFFERFKTLYKKLREKELQSDKSN